MNRLSRWYWRSNGPRPVRRRELWVEPIVWAVVLYLALTALWWVILR